MCIYILIYVHFHLSFLPLLFFLGATTTAATADEAAVVAQAHAGQLGAHIAGLRVHVGAERLAIRALGHLAEPLGHGLLGLRQDGDQRSGERTVVVRRGVEKADRLARVAAAARAADSVHIPTKQAKHTA